MFDIDHAREKLKNALSSFRATLPETFSIWRLELDAAGRLAKYLGEKMMPLSALPLLLGKGDISTDEGAYQCFIPAYLSAAHSLDFDESVFQDVVSQIVEFQRSHCYRFTTFAFLFGCRASIEFQCGPLLIGPPNAHCLEVLYNTWDVLKGGHSPFSLNRPGLINLLNSAVMIRNVTSVLDVKEIPPLDNAVSTFLKAIGLSHGVRQGLVLSPIQTRSDLYLPGAASRVCYIHGFDITQSDSINPFIIDADKISARYSELVRCANLPFLAPDKILSAMTRITPEDKYVDLITALESCFENIRQELRYRLSLSCAAVLGRSFTVYKEMLDLYDVRSNIVHGNFKPNDIRDDLEKLESYVIPVIGYFLSELARGNAKSLDEANKKIEKLLLSAP